MAIDISKVFKANVKAIRMNISDGADKSDILNEQLLKTSKKKTGESISKQAKNIINNITILKNFLNENKKLYIQPNYLVFNQSNDINDTDWQRFEDQAENVIKKCSDAIAQLKQNAYNDILSHQYKEHLDNLVYLLDKYLKDVCKVYSEQKAIRVKRALEKKNYSQLFSPTLINQLDIESKTNTNDDNETKKKDLKYDHLDEELEKEKNNEYKKIESCLSPQELLALEKENELLFETLSAQTEEIRKIESEVIEVSRLTQIFTENIVSQLSTVESVQRSAIETNSNLTMGNDDIKEAMKKNAALRLWILFIIVVLSFTLLFLDWYND